MELENKMKLKSNILFLYCGILAVLLYISNTIVLGFLYPEYNHISQFISELGMDNAPNNVIFKYALILTNLLFSLSSIGLYNVVEKNTNNKKQASLTALCTMLFGISFFFSGYFALPDPLHNGFGLGVFGIITPFVFVWIYWNNNESDKIKFNNYFSILLIIAAVSITIVFGNETNQGLFQRIFVLSFFSWYFFTYLYLIKDCKKHFETQNKVFQKDKTHA